ncbi:conserved hypothetical protein [Candidatus Zixiibacteriota bacterium]|nr:conserved hypothetical protein [candidate division Zixibacteria bacterium]
MPDIPGNKPSDEGYEKKDINVAKVFMFVALAAGFLVVAILLLNNYFTEATEEQVYSAVLKPESVALRDLRAREDGILNSYKLLDSAKGIYQIPIERAMKVMADEAFRESQKEEKAK